MTSLKYLDPPLISILNKQDYKIIMKNRKTEARIMPIIAPTDIPLLDSDDWLLDDGGVRVPDPE